MMSVSITKVLKDFLTNRKYTDKALKKMRVKTMPRVFVIIMDDIKAVVTNNAGRFIIDHL